jgi:hypothetical protein
MRSAARFGDRADPLVASGDPADGAAGASVAFRTIDTDACSRDVLAGQKKRGKTLYTRTLKITGIIYDSPSHSATITLAKPDKGPIDVVVDGAIEAEDGTTSNIDYEAILPP